MKLQFNSSSSSSSSNPRYTPSNINLSAELGVAVFMLTFSLICLSIPFLTSGQTDCKMIFTYNWTTDPRVNKNIELGLPTTQFLGGHASEEDEGAFYYVALNSNKATLASHLSSDFCRDYDWLIGNFFKANRSFYLLKLRINPDERTEGFKVKEIKIPMDSMDIFFDFEKRHIIIKLPTIKALQ